MKCLTLFPAALVLFVGCASSSVDSSDIEPSIDIVSSELIDYMAADELISDSNRAELISAADLLLVALAAQDSIDLVAYGPQIEAIAEAHSAYVSNDSRLNEFSKRTRLRTSNLLIKLVDEAK